MNKVVSISEKKWERIQESNRNKEKEYNGEEIHIRNSIRMSADTGEINSSSVEHTYSCGNRYVLYVYKGYLYIIERTKEVIELLISSPYWKSCDYLSQIVDFAI